LRNGRTSDRRTARLVFQSVALPGPLEHIPVEVYRRQLEVNLIGQLAVTQAMLPALRKARGRARTRGS
jgi:NAD(P)-dependent dehydrogenase (short-subunit alcohol dehydrogenase family)